MVKWYIMCYDIIPLSQFLSNCIFLLYFYKRIVQGTIVLFIMYESYLGNNTAENGVFLSFFL
jgi:hypothetical protein